MRRRYTRETILICVHPRESAAKWPSSELSSRPLPYTADGTFGVKTYAFKVVAEPDEGGFHTYCPALRRFGAVTQGATSEEALKNINEVVQIIVDELREDGIEIPSA